MRTSNIAARCAHRLPCMIPITTIVAIALVIAGVCAVPVRSAPALDWHAAQNAYIIAERQAPTLGDAAAGVQPAWDAYMRALSAYTKSAFNIPAVLLTRTLNRPDTFMYDVRDFATPFSRLRLVTLVESGNETGVAPDFPPLQALVDSGARRAAQLLLWRSASNAV
jgi:hypothetical protein